MSQTIAAVVDIRCSQADEHMNADGGVERIVVGVDGSANSIRALEWAIAVARGNRAEILAVHAFRPGHGSTAWSGDGKEARRQAQISFEYNWCLPLTHAGLPYRAIFVDGNPVATLVATAVEQHADLIVVGARGLGGFSELLLGSVSQQLASHTPVPLVLVPAAFKPLALPASRPGHPASTAVL